MPLYQIFSTFSRSKEYKANKIYKTRGIFSIYVLTVKYPVESLGKSGLEASSHILPLVSRKYELSNKNRKVLQKTVKILTISFI